MDFSALERERDQLWAEAALLEGVWGALVLSDEVLDEMREIQEDRIEYEPGVDDIVDAITKLEGGFVSNQTLLKALGFHDDKKHLRYNSGARFAMKQLKARLSAKGWTGDRISTERGVGKRRKGLLDKPIIDYNEVDRFHIRPRVEL
jgi:hypothetical protein